MAAVKAGNVSTLQKAFNAFRGWYVYAAGYRQLGLRADDLRMEENPDVTTAISRLPEEAQYQRIFRVKRAMDLSLKHQLLPRSEWTKPEEDTLYLADMIEKAKQERKEREEWDRK
ncbi:cytochrome b-c1 complex subunit 7-like [Clytia hemisphaerica]|uniref:Cytochrome b-c1 complex subunit 7 n=1 Tax=Clytia hemisphaerica TaxID=252671 RepID=A0A7M5UMK0_9CNID